MRLPSCLWLMQWFFQAGRRGNFSHEVWCNYPRNGYEGKESMEKEGKFWALSLTIFLLMQEALIIIITTAMMGMKTNPNYQS